jgi:GDP-L-fucose synthase
MENYSAEDPVNIGTGTEISIKDLALSIAEATGFKGNLKFNPDYPDGTPRKVMDSSKLLGLGWAPKIQLQTGIAKTIEETDWANTL